MSAQPRRSSTSHGGESISSATLADADTPTLAEDRSSSSASCCIAGHAPAHAAPYIAQSSAAYATVEQASFADDETAMSTERGNSVCPAGSQDAYNHAEFECMASHVDDDTSYDSFEPFYLHRWCPTRNREGDGGATEAASTYHHRVSFDRVLSHAAIPIAGSSQQDALDHQPCLQGAAAIAAAVGVKLSQPTPLWRVYTRGERGCSPRRRIQSSGRTTGGPGSPGRPWVGTRNIGAVPGAMRPSRVRGGPRSTAVDLPCTPSEGPATRARALRTTFRVSRLGYSRTGPDPSNLAD